MSSDQVDYEELTDDQMLLCCICKKLLNDPVQLQCLHSCCRHCLDVGTADDVGPFVTCPACSHQTYTATASSNALIDLKVRHFKSYIDARMCSLCSNTGSNRVAAMVWCKACGKSFCADCMLWHSTCNKDHITVTVEEMSACSQTVTMPALSCLQHGKAYEFVCLTCQTTKCIDCWATCNKLKHDMMLVSDDSMPSRAAKVKEELAGLEQDLLSKAGLLKKHLSLPDELRAARAEHLKEVRRRKKVIMDAVDSACITVEEVVKDMYDTLDQEASDMKAAAIQLDMRVGQAVDYFHYVVNCNIVSALLHEQKQLLTQLTSLVKEVEAVRSPVHAADAVVISSSIPADLGQQASAWIGTPRFARDDLVCGAEELESLNATAAPCDVENVDLLPSGPSQQHDAEDGKLGLGTASSSFTTPAQCWDVAVTADGHLLLAAGDRGMQEYDESGRQLSSWTPAKTARRIPDEVYTVDELQDGRVAVGLNYACTVQLLGRNAAARDSWQQQQVFQLQGPPWQLSVHAQLMAVTEGWEGLWLQFVLLTVHAQFVYGAAAVAEGRRPWQLVLLSLTDGRELLRHDPGYIIYSVAATADAVITASGGRVQLSDGRGQYLVDSYSHSGQLLWRQSFNEQVYGLRWSQVPSVVHLALQDSDRVTAIRAVDGQQVSELLSSSHGLKKPWRLSLSRGPRTVLAVLHGDNKTVTVYPALGSGGSK